MVIFQRFDRLERASAKRALELLMAVEVEARQP